MNHHHHHNIRELSKSQISTHSQLRIEYKFISIDMRERYKLVLTILTNSLPPNLPMTMKEDAFQRHYYCVHQILLHPFFLISFPSLLLLLQRCEWLQSRLSMIMIIICSIFSISSSSFNLYRHYFLHRNIL